MHRVVRHVIAVFALLAAAHASAQPLREDPWIIVTDPQDRLITWIPTTKQVLAAQQAARDTLRRVAKQTHHRQARDARDILEHWHGYRLQACGLTQDHRRIIYLNFITPDSSSDTDWKHNALLEVSDGGFYFWQAKYDPTTGKIISWQANGLA